MARYQNLIGQTFNNLKVIAPTEKRTKDGGMIWLCECVCGNKKEIRAKSLKNGNTKSCGCLQKKIASDRLKKDLTGQIFGELKALYPTEERKHGSIVWQCECSCGNLHKATAELLLSGSVKSCGCIRSRGNSKVQKILNELHENFVKEYCVRIDNINYYYDFCVLRDNKIFCFIEYDGVLHFKQDRYHGWNNEENWIRTHKNDKIKNNYAEEHGIKLIRIPYTDYDKIDKKYLLERME